MKRGGTCLLALVAVVPWAVAACSKDRNLPGAPAMLSASTTPLSASECEGLLTEAQLALDDARHAASTQCARDTDCVTVGTRACLGDCGSYAIATSAASSYQAAASVIGHGKCQTWRDRGCPSTTPQAIATCQIFVPTCTNGTCAARQGP
jgi:hypothetical protein